MAASNTSFERTLALIVAGQEIQQDADVVGTALKSISSRIRKMNEETGEFDETLQTISGDVYELTNNRVSIMEDENTYKDIYKILKEISEVWDDLTDKQHAQLLDKLFGSRQVNVGSAILQNFSQAEKALSMISDGAADGSSMREMETILDSVDYKANEFKETLVGIAQNSITRDFLKTMIESGTKLLETISDAAPVLNTLLSLFGEGTKAAAGFVNTIGLLPSILAGLSLRNIGKLKQNTPSYAPLRLCA